MCVHKYKYNRHSRRHRHSNIQVFWMRDIGIDEERKV